MTDLCFHAKFLANLNGNCIRILRRPTEDTISLISERRSKRMPVDDGHRSTCFGNSSAELVSNTTIACTQTSQRCIEQMSVRVLTTRDDDSLA
jgi:hypothetical protein